MVYSVRIMLFVMVVIMRFALYLVRDLRGLYVMFLEGNVPQVRIMYGSCLCCGC